MPIMAATGGSDARAAARLLAGTAVECLKAPEKAPSMAVAINNVYRLLEAYRSNQFFGLETSARPGTVRTMGPLTSTTLSERHVRDVRLAINDAVKQTFDDASVDHAVDLIEQALRGLIYPDKFQAPSAADLGRVTHFFERLRQTLMHV